MPNPIILITENNSKDPDAIVVLAVRLMPTQEEVDDLKSRHPAYADEIQRQFEEASK